MRKIISGLCIVNHFFDLDLKKKKKKAEKELDAVLLVFSLLANGCLAGIFPEG